MVIEVTDDERTLVLVNGRRVIGVTSLDIEAGWVDVIDPAQLPTLEVPGPEDKTTPKPPPDMSDPQCIRLPTRRLYGTVQIKRLT